MKKKTALPVEPHRRSKSAQDEAPCTVDGQSKNAEELVSLATKIINNEQLERIAKVMRALSDPTRLKILWLLGERDMCVCDVMTALSLTQPTTSYHLNILTIAGLVKTERNGKWIIYRLVDSNALPLLEYLRKAI